MFFKSKETDLRTPNPEDSENLDSLDHDPEYEFYGEGPKRYSMLMFILGSLESDSAESLYEELLDLGEKLEENEEAHLPSLYEFQARAISEIRRHFPQPSPLDFETENERLSDLLLRFEYQHIIAQIYEDQEDATDILDSAQEFMERLSADFDNTIESQEEGMNGQEDLFMHDLEEMMASSEDGN